MKKAEAKKDDEKVSQWSKRPADDDFEDGGFDDFLRGWIWCSEETLWWWWFWRWCIGWFEEECSEETKTIEEKLVFWTDDDICLVL